MHTEKFKTGWMSINLIGKLRRETASSWALIPRVLRRGCTGLTDMEQISAALDDLYGTRIEPIVRKKGDLHCIGLYADFPDDRYIPGYDMTRESGSIQGYESLFEKTASLLCDILLSPVQKNGAFIPEYVESEKNNLIDDILASINDKRGYSIKRLIEEMCAGELYSVNRLGSEDEARKISPESLIGHYHDVIATSRIEAFYCGSAEPERVEAALRPAFSRLPQRTASAIPKTEIILYPSSDPPKRFTEAFDVVQGKLTAGFRLGKAMNDPPDYPALMVFNALYGSGETSRLFLNVRERLSLCYYVGSIIDRHKGIMIVTAGVDFSRFEATLEEMLAQLEHIKKGEFEDWELTAAKRSVVTSIRLAMDKPGGLEDLYFDNLIAKHSYDPLDLCESADAVTPDRIVEIASEIAADSIYFMTGIGGDGDDA